ncbi:MAG: anti-sigma factor family protein [Bacteroidota bacterium]
MNCQEVRALSGAAIDGVLPGDAEAEFHKHIALCPPCRNEFELEAMAKRVVRRIVKRVPTPPQVYDAVVASLQDVQKVTGPSAGRVERFFSKRFAVPALATGAAAIVLLLMVSPLERSDLATRHTAANDIINQSIVNFALVRSGELKPTMISCYAEGVIGFFDRNGMRFAVNVKPLDNCDWYGALSSDYNGVKLAHVVYKIGDDLMYVFQVSEDEVQDGSLLQLPSAAKKALAATNWYTDPDHPDCNVVLWKDKGTLCAAVSTLKKDRLLALLTTN